MFSTLMPLPALAEITLRAAAVRPPMVLPGAAFRTTPSSALPRSRHPAELVPIRLPAIRLPVAVPPSTSTPNVRLAAMTFPSPGLIAADEVVRALSIDTPDEELGRAVTAGRVGADQVTLDLVAGSRPCRR